MIEQPDHDEWQELTKKDVLLHVVEKLVYAIYRAEQAGLESMAVKMQACLAHARDELKLCLSEEATQKHRYDA